MRVYMTILALIVDDDAPTRFVYKRVLVSLGFDVIEAADGIQALAALHEFQPRLILLDWLLPNRPGADVLKAIYADPALRDSYVIVISSQNRIDLEVELREGDIFLRKPALPQQIRDAVRVVN